MKNKKVIYRCCIFLLLLCSSSLSAQLTATDTSERSVRKYQQVIRSNKQLVSLIEYTFAQRKVPKFMRNLAIIESGLDHQAVSTAGARGVWQFMTPHAQQYGLSEEDRSDMYKSTRTAVNSLINLYNKYGNWVTVVAAYNCGEGNIAKAMSAAGSKRYTDFAPFLPAETQMHVKKFLNASYATGELQAVLADYHKTGTAPAAVAQKTVQKPGKPFTKNSGKLSEIVLNGAFDLTVIAERLDIELSTLLGWNPGIEQALAEKGQSVFYLPREKMLDFHLTKNEILTASLNSNE